MDASKIVAPNPGRRTRSRSRVTVSCRCSPTGLSRQRRDEVLDLARHADAHRVREDHLVRARRRHRVRVLDHEARVDLASNGSRTRRYRRSS